MAYTKLIMENPNTGEIKEAPVGFSWTVFFFGFFSAPFQRGLEMGGHHVPAGHVYAGP